MTVVRAMLFLVSILVLMTANVTVGWLIDARVLALVTLAIATVAALMVVYLDGEQECLTEFLLRVTSTEKPLEGIVRSRYARGR